MLCNNIFVVIFNDVKKCKFFEVRQRKYYFILNCRYVYDTGINYTFKNHKLEIFCFIINHYIENKPLYWDDVAKN